MRALTGSLLAAALAIVSFAPAVASISGSTLNGTIQNDVNTKTAYVGQKIVLNNVTSADGSGTVTKGTLYGHVASVQKAGQGRPAQLKLVFDTLVTPSGNTYAVDGQVSGMRAVTKSNALKEAGGALGGMLIGNMIGKTVFHSGWGGFLGAAGGYIAAKNNREDMTVPAGSIVSVKVYTARKQTHR